VGWIAGAILGFPIVFLLLSALAASTEWGQMQIGRMELPAGVDSYTLAIVQRWLGEPWTLLLVGGLLSAVFAELFVLLRQPAARWYRSLDLVFVLLLVAIGLALVYAPEFVFLRDHFGSRMNTVFKFYYQGWLLLGIATAYGMTLALYNLRRRIGVAEVLALFSFLLILGAAIFPIAGVYAKTGGFAREVPTLDATAYVAQAAPDVMAAVEWVQQNTTPDAIVLEGKGGSYSAQHNRISTMTGRGTLLGWDGHESQWRGKAYGEMAQGRPEAIDQIYRSAGPEELNAILEEWGIDYVFVGPAESELYGITATRLEERGEAMDTVFSRGQVRIFRRRES
jgi:uncharacterized membrane protein